MSSTSCVYFANDQDHSWFHQTTAATTSTSSFAGGVLRRTAHGVPCQPMLSTPCRVYVEPPCPIRWWSRSFKISKVSIVSSRVPYFLLKKKSNSPRQKIKPDRVADLFQKANDILGYLIFITKIYCFLQKKTYKTKHILSFPSKWHSNLWPVFSQESDITLAGGKCGVTHDIFHLEFYGRHADFTFIKNELLINFLSYSV